MTRSRIFFLSLLAFVVGVFARSFFETKPFLAFALAVFSLTILFVFYRSRNALIFSSLLLSFALGLWRTEAFISRAGNASLSGEKYHGSAIIAAEPQLKEDFQNVIVKIRNSEGDPGALLALSRIPDLSYGDEIKLDCALEIPQNKEANFDYRMFLAKSGIFYVCKNTKIEKTGRNEGNFLYRKLLALKKSLEKNVATAIPEPQSALANGMLFGGTAGLSEKVKEDFSRTGMTHIVAVSGFNVAIIAESLVAAGLFLGLWRNKAIWLAIFGIAVFVLMIGFPPSAVRAGVMGGVLLWAMKNGRLSDSVNAVVFSGAAMLFFNPLLLRWDIGFQLSFLATLGIVILSPLFENSFMKKHKALGLFEMVILAICAQIFVLPIIALNFQTFSAVSLLANVLVLPAVPFSMLLGFLAAVGGFVSAPLSAVFAWLAYLSLRYETEVVGFLADFEWASVGVSGFGARLVVLYYLVLALAVYYFKKRKAVCGTEN